MASRCGGRCQFAPGPCVWVVQSVNGAERGSPEVAVAAVATVATVAVAVAATTATAAVVATAAAAAAAAKGPGARWYGTADGVRGAQASACLPLRARCLAFSTR